MLSVIKCLTDEEEEYVSVNKDVFGKIVDFLFVDTLVYWLGSYRHVLNIRRWSRKHKHFIDNFKPFWMGFVKRRSIIYEENDLVGSVIRYFAKSKLERAILSNKELGKQLSSGRQKIARRKRKIEETQEEINVLEIEQYHATKTREDNTKAIEEITLLYNFKRPKKVLF